MVLFLSQENKSKLNTLAQAIIQLEKTKKNYLDSIAENHTNLNLANNLAEKKIHRDLLEKNQKIYAAIHQEIEILNLVSKGIQLIRNNPFYSNDDISTLLSPFVAGKSQKYINELMDNVIDFSDAKRVYLERVAAAIFILGACSAVAFGVAIGLHAPVLVILMLEMPMVFGLLGGTFTYLGSKGNKNQLTQIQAHLTQTKKGEAVALNAADYQLSVNQNKPKRYINDITVKTFEDNSSKVNASCTLRIGNQLVNTKLSDKLALRAHLNNSQNQELKQEIISEINHINAQGYYVSFSYQLSDGDESSVKHTKIDKTVSYKRTELRELFFAKQEENQPSVADGALSVINTA